MTRRSRYALTKVSADIPVSLVQQLDGWKSNIDGISRSQLISDLLKWSLDQGASMHFIQHALTTIITVLKLNAIVIWGAVR
ncbi:MAG: hypothetical protein CM15mP42_03360 [Methanobacteriota archaeon]|nr:MAG: hypothetical protein CM15mP42_03360 [Euryarchaeota archaeon]